MSDKNLSAFIQYGVPSDKAAKLDDLELTVSEIRSLSQQDLVKHYGLVVEEIKFVKNCVKRDPIDEDTVQFLLEKSNFTCCLCKGVKSDGYIIHHIEEYSKSQDNGFENLAVLCLLVLTCPLL